MFGGLLSQLGWRWVFLVPAPLAALLLIAGIYLLDRSDKPARADKNYDLPGAAAITVSDLVDLSPAS